GGQIGYLHPRQDQKTDVIDDQMPALGYLVLIPFYPLITRFEHPSCIAPAEACNGLSLDRGKIFYLPSNDFAGMQIVVAGYQLIPHFFRCRICHSLERDVSEIY